MKPIKEGQIVKFHTPLAGEDPNQQFVVIEIFPDAERSRAQIQALNTGLSLPPINTVLVSDLEVIEADTADLLGHIVTIRKSDYSEIEGKVVEVSEQKINLDLTKGVHGIETNVWVTVVDNEGNKHHGTLFVHA